MQLDEERYVSQWCIVIITVLGLLLFAFALLADFSVNEQFESGAKPTNWMEWSTENHPATWAFKPAMEGSNSICVGQTTNLAAGVFFTFPEATDDVLVTFLFRYTQFPTSGIIEVLDLYSPGFMDELFDTYLTNDGRLRTYLPGTANGVTSAVPTNRTVRLWVRLKHTGDFSYQGSAAWSTNDTEPISGPQFASISTSNAPTDSMTHGLLFGPITSPTTFIYDDVRVTSPASEQPMITRLVYQVCPPIADGVEYAVTHSSLYADYSDTDGFSGSVYLGALAQITLTWTASSNRTYAVEATPALDDWRAPWLRVSPWLVSGNGSLSFTQASPFGQAFYRIKAE